MVLEKRRIMRNPTKVLIRAAMVLAAVLTGFMAADRAAIASKAGCFPSTPQFELLSPIPVTKRGLITHGPRSGKNVALTFDLCQSQGARSGFDQEIVRILSEAEAPATFFPGGLWMRDHRDETRALADNLLFELGNHSWSHPDFSRIPPERMTEEIRKTQRIMWELIGYQTRLFRFPYGRYSEKALDVIGQNGLYPIQWDVVSGDPDPKIDADRMAHWVLSRMKPGSIVIMHANGRGRHTAKALLPIIHGLRGKGYAPVTVSRLLGLQR
jgi:peptidoglycan/xylan/chitin deacetylase (PgdA/CDA1 family)